MPLLVFVHPRGGFILEGLVRHHVAPMARWISYAEEDWLVFGARLGERFFRPGIPIHGVVGVLEQIGEVEEARWFMGERMKQKNFRNLWRLRKFRLSGYLYILWQRPLGKEDGLPGSQPYEFPAGLFLLFSQIGHNGLQVVIKARRVLIAYLPNFFNDGIAYHG
jgi:hypothetical protein